MPLRNIKEEKKLATKILLYGKPGTGKTTASKYLKGKTFMFSLDNSFHRIPEWKKSSDVWTVDTNRPVQDAADFCRWFNKNGDKYTNIVVDNLTNYQRIWFSDAAKQTRSGMDNKIQDYGRYNTFMTRMLGYFIALPQTVLFTTWEEVDDTTDEKGGQLKVVRPSLRSVVRDYLEGNCDMVARLIVSPEGRRGCYLLGTASIDAKNRLDNRKGCKVEDLFKPLYNDSEDVKGDTNDEK